jgi:signal transduction histidine kinase/ligand-binding sensor domain-containing protein/ActR/RegA family two-component response regulator
MSSCKQVFRQTVLKIAIVAVLPALLFPCVAPPHGEAQVADSLQLDPARLVFETAAGDYGNIYNVIQDKDGFLWLAGINGVIKYNGYGAETIYSGERVSALFQDSEGWIWIAARSGIVVYDKKTGEIHKFIPRPDEPDSLSGESLISFQKTQLFTEDRDGLIWIATVNGLNKFDKKSGKFTAYRNRSDDPETLFDNDVWSVLTAKDGLLWAGTVTGLHRFDPGTGRVVERYAANSDDPGSIHGKNVQATVEDDEGIIWAGTTEGGLNRLNPVEKTFSHYRADAGSPQKIANNFIYRLACFDSAPDLIWITTFDGLSILNKRDNTVTNYVYDAKKVGKGGLGGKIIHTIIQDRSGIFWLVAKEHGVLQKIDPGALQFQSILPGQNPKEGLVAGPSPLRLGPDGNIWVTEIATGIARINPETGRIVQHFLHDPQKPEGFPQHIEDFDFEPRQKNIIWVVVKGSVVEFDWYTQTVVNSYPSGTQSKIWPVWTDKQNPDFLYGTVWGKGLLKFNKQTGHGTIFKPDPVSPEETLSTGTPFPILPLYYQMEGNRIWLSHPGAGFDLFDFESEKVIRKHLFNETDFTREEFTAHTGFIDSKGRVWIGHNQYDEAGGKFIPFKSLYGLGYPSSPSCSLTEDKQGLLWSAGFMDGTVTRINPETGQTRVFTERDGISPGLASAYTPVTLPDGQIWMSGTAGVTYFYPDQITDNPYSPPVFITKLTQGGEPMQLGMAPERVKEITLNWTEAFFEFEMTALSYRRPEKNQYQYMLEGVDKDWYKAGTKRNGRYSGLPAGTYTLRIRGSNNDGVWSGREATLAITVTPPWWGMGWFRGSIVAALLALAFTGYRLRVGSMAQHSRELERQVTERTQELQFATDAAEKARQSAETANLAKSVFLANMSHELRTPLNAVIGFSQLMKNSPGVTPDQMENLTIITRSGEHLLVLINNVLDISKIESGRVEVKETPFDLHLLIQEIKSLMYVRTNEKGLAFMLEQSEDLPRHVVGDGGKLRQVLINLIGNAVKYTASGTVIFRAMAAEKEGAGRMLVRFEVEDTGPGIREEDRERIFLPFAQLADRPSAEAGTGLGLAICRQYVELMGGEIRVASAPGKGSVFQFRIPVVMLAPEANPVEPGRGRVLGVAQGQPRYRLLIAEDQPENRLLLRKLLDPLGFDLREAVNGLEAVLIFKEWHPHLIWMDIRMPVMDGLEATRQIKATDAGALTRIIALTAHALEEERREILGAGCDDVIRKPYEYIQIFDALTKHLGVGFVYEEETKPVSGGSVDTAALAGLPDELLNGLEQALVRIDIGAVSRAIEAIRARNPSLADALAVVAGDLQFNRILRLIRAAAASIDPEEDKT